MRQLIDVGTPRGLQDRVRAVVVALLALTGSLRALTTRHRRIVEQMSPLTRRSIAKFGVVHVGARSGFYHGLLSEVGGVRPRFTAGYFPTAPSFIFDIISPMLPCMLWCCRTSVVSSSAIASTLAWP